MEPLEGGGASSFIIQGQIGLLWKYKVELERGLIDLHFEVTVKDMQKIFPFPEINSE